MVWLRFLKFILFFLLMPIAVPFALFMTLTFERWTKLYPDRKLWFFLLSPIYAPLALIYNIAFDGWIKLAD